ncbi:MAG: chorismate mutase [Methanomicrobiales archaeon HGW-Methanomicrobiales-4]|nr:MAG: chorismate mutase [Methanomicrobiales archaeon HGW-Methanomicrobiales-4]
MTLQELRGEIEAVDREILRLFRARMDIAVRIAEEKAALGLPTRDSERAGTVLSGVGVQAEALGLDPDLVREIFSILIRMSEDLQDRKRG